MSEHDSWEHQGQQELYQSQDGQNNDTTMNTLLEARITHVLQKKAANIHFTPVARSQIMERIHARRQARRRVFVPTFAAAIAALLVLAIISASLLIHQSITTIQLASIHYALKTTVDTPSQLAQGGHLVSLDPTGHHLVYQSAQGLGVMYTANIDQPDATNVLAMRDARAASWSPDGSSLVATIQPDATQAPFLALIHTGSYMMPLGHTALAATYSPVLPEHIVYVTQQHGATQLFSTSPQQNQQAQLLTTLNIIMPVQGLISSPDGHMLALLAATGNAQSSLHALYLLDMQTYTLKTIVAPGNASLGDIAWSPDNHYLAYESTNTHGNVTIQAQDATTGRFAFAIPSHSALNGWSWSPHSDAIVYSDGGKLSAYILHGAKITFASSSVAQVSPFWLPDGRILCLNLTQGTGSLALLAAQK